MSPVPRSLPTLAWIIQVAAGVLATAVAADYLDFEGDDPLAPWSFYDGHEFPGAEGAVVLRRDGARHGNACAALQFDFSRGGGYVQANAPVPAGTDPDRVAFSVHKPFRNRLTVRAIDAGDETFQKSIHFRSPSWQDVEIDLLRWDFSYGGDGDHRVDRPLRSIGILVDRGPCEAGELLVDEFRFSRGSAGPEPEVATMGTDMQPAETAYRLTDFRAPYEGWHLLVDGGDAADSTWSDGELRYDFSGGAGAVGVRTWAVSFHGEPSAMIARLRGDVAGHRLRVRMQSHFQTFERDLGPLEPGPDGVVNARSSLGGMEDWRHYGGEDDGVLRRPLRPVEFAIVRGNGPERGSIRFECVEVEARLAPDERVALVPGAVLDPGDSTTNGASARLSVRATDLRPDGGRVTVRAVARDWDGRRVAAAERTVETGGAGATAPVEFDLPAGNLRFVRIELEGVDSNGDVLGRSRTSAVLPPPPETVDPAGDPSRRIDRDSPVGVGLYLYRFPANDWGYETMDRLASLARRAGVKWSREEFSWNRIEPRRGERDWAFYDRLVEIEAAHGIQVYGLLCYWTAWTADYTPEGIEQYCDFVREAAARYRGRVDHWEIWNEPNIFFWSGPREMYADLLAAAYVAVKEGNPDAEVLGCSTSGIDRPFIEQVVRAGAPFDVLTIHPYRGIFADGAYIDELREIRRVVELPDGTERPVWITEMGWPSQIGGTTERNQAALLARVYLGAFASRAVESVAWYDFREDGPNPFYHEHHFGIVRHESLDPKPAYLALAELTRRIDAKIPPEELLGPGEDVLAYRFRRGDGHVLVLWSEHGDHAIRLREVTGPVRVVNLMGEVTDVEPRDGAVLLGLEEEFPVFVEGAGIGPATRPEFVALTVRANPSPVAPSGECRLDLEAGEGITVSNAEWWLPDEATAEIVTGDTPASALLRVGPVDRPDEIAVAVRVTTPAGTIRFGHRVPVLPPTIRF